MNKGPGPRAPSHRLVGSKPSESARLWRRVLPLALLLMVMVAAYASDVGGLFSWETLLANHDRLMAFIGAHPVWSIAIFLIGYAAVVALSLPVAGIMTLGGGLLFGWAVGGVAAVIGATLGAVAIFLITRSSLGNLLAARAGPRLAALRAGFQANALSYLLFLRLVPLFPFWLVNVAPALLGMRLPGFVLGTFVGIIPGTFAYAFLGSGLEDILARKHAAYRACLAANPGNGAENCQIHLAPGDLLTSELLVAFFLLGVLALLPILFKRKRQEQ